mmetsp:Transcript_13968/g.20132  ORF Transcript_13968/g.20132 Transcript_13968/m.20132 type:complete len:98 (+) Transcript_13968:265-558(+)
MPIDKKFLNMNEVSKKLLGRNKNNKRKNGTMVGATMLLARFDFCELFTLAFLCMTREQGEDEDIFLLLFVCVFFVCFSSHQKVLLFDDDSFNSIENK